MPKWKKGHTTPHVCVPITNPQRNIPSDHDKQARYRLQHSVLDSFHTEIQGPVYLSVGSDAKLDVLKTFDLDKPFDLHLDPAPSENLPLCRITQDGPYYNHRLLSYKHGTKRVDPPSPLANNETATSTTAATAASNFDTRNNA